MVKAQRSRDTDAANASRRLQDVYGLLLFFVGAASLLCLAWPDRDALLPRRIDAGLRLLAGTGAYVIPLLFMLVGTMFLIGYRRLTLTHSTAGTVLLFLNYVTWRHLVCVPVTETWSPKQIESAGGVIGALFGAALNTLIGHQIAYLLLVALTAISITLLSDQPFIQLLKSIHERATAGAKTATETIERGAKAGKELIPAKRNTLAITEPDRAVVEARDERAARVVERALVPVGGVEEIDGDRPGGKRNLLNLANPWRGKEILADVPATPIEEEKPSLASEPVERKGKAEAKTPDLGTGKPSEASQLRMKLYELPPLTLLKEAPPSVGRRSHAELTDKVKVIEQTLEQFNIGANVVEVASGPSVTRYEIQLAPGIKVSKIVSLADNLAMSLAAIDVRIEAPIPGKSAIGVEVPNGAPALVSLRECLETDEFKRAPSMLTVALGKDVAGHYKYADLTKMPHLLIGGSTNSGKSVCLNVLIASLLYRASPRDVKLLMIDPKRVELSLWDGIPHLMHPVVKDVRQAAGVFRAAIKEMDRRYDLFATFGTRNIEGYNQRVPEGERLPFLVLIVDELADLMMQQGPEIETGICRLAQLARATGIHLVIATQRPSVDVITGTIKANISSRIAFAVASQVDSRTILDMAGAERLIGRGDMLFMPIDAAKPVRIQGAYLSETETNTLVKYLKEQEQPDYTFSVAEIGSHGDSPRGGGPDTGEDFDDAFFEQAVRLVVNNGQASTSMLLRRFRIGYTRAARIVEMMEERGIVGALNGAKPREILVSKDEVERMFRPGSLPPSVATYQDEE